MIKNKKGFTLIELMIVMLIIGILAVVALVAIAGKSVDARDSRRLADANAIQFTFALHAIEHGSDYLEGAWPGVLLNDLGNKADIADMMNLDGVKDPIDGRTDICYDGAGMVLQCNQAGGYTVFDMYDDLGDLYLGTFDNYAIGIKLESTESIAYFENFDWRKLMGVKTANAATCGDWVCEEDETALNCADDCFCGDLICDASEDEVSCEWDCLATVCGDAVCNGSETNISCADDCYCGNGSCEFGSSEDIWNCADDCYCGNGICDSGENPFSCAPDCSPPEVCGNGMCQLNEANTGSCPADCCGNGFCSAGEDIDSCPADCGGGGGEGDYDENDWLYIGPGGVNRTSFDGIDLYNYTYSD